MVRSDKLWKLLNCVSQLQPKISQLSDQLQGFNLPFWKWEIITFTMEKVSASSCPPLLRKMQKTDRDFLVEKLSEIQDSQTSFNFHDWGRDSSQLKRFPLYWHGSLISKMYNWSSVVQRTVELWMIDFVIISICLYFHCPKGSQKVYERDPDEGWCQTLMSLANKHSLLLY